MREPPWSAQIICAHSALDTSNRVFSPTPPDTSCLHTSHVHAPHWAPSGCKAAVLQCLCVMSPLAFIPALHGRHGQQHRASRVAGERTGARAERINPSGGSAAVHAQVALPASSFLRPGISELQMLHCTSAWYGEGGERTQTPPHSYIRSHPLPPFCGEF